MTRIGWVCVTMLLLSACSLKTAETVTPTASPIPVSTPDMAMEEERVYAAVITALYPADMLVIMDKTQTDVIGLASAETYQHVKESMQHLSPETLADFTIRNDSSYTLKASMALGVRYILFSEQERKELFQVNQSGWDVFYNRYLGAPGIMSLSRVGFNLKMDQALVYLGIQSHWLAGSGNFILLNQINGSWEIDQQVMSWIS